MLFRSKDVYTDVISVLSNVEGCQVTDRYEAESGVFVTEYSNGKCVIVNYGSTDFATDGITVPAHSASVK